MGFCRIYKKIPAIPQNLNAEFFMASNDYIDSAKSSDFNFMDCHSIFSKCFAMTKLAESPFILAILAMTPL